MEIIKTLKEGAIDNLMVSEGKPLDLTANFSSSLQVKAMLESHALGYLGSLYIQDRADMMKRLTVSYQGRGRTDIVTIASSSRDDGFNFGGVDG